MWLFWFGLLFICDPSSIKAALLLYYTSVLILTKITTISSLWDPHCTWPKGLMKLKDWDCLWAQHTSWSLVLPPSRSHGNVHIPLGSTSYVLDSTSNFCEDQFLTDAPFGSYQVQCLSSKVYLTFIVRKVPFTENIPFIYVVGESHIKLTKCILRFCLLVILVGPQGPFIYVVGWWHESHISFCFCKFADITAVTEFGSEPFPGL